MTDFSDNKIVSARRRPPDVSAKNDLEGLFV